MTGTPPRPTGYTYADSGVDIDAGDAFVERLGPLVAATRRPGVMGGLGGFGALFDPAATGFRDPLLVAATDGVGTKLMIAQACGLHDGIGQDLVAMCANDVVAQGAEPVFFLDYLATGRLEGMVLDSIVAGIARACQDIGAALIGGETAEMPGFYAPGHYDCAGFCVGMVERDRVLPRLGDVVPGDVVLGLGGNGLHSNGFSLVRRLIADHGLALDAAPPFDSPAATLGAALLAPTPLYVRPVLAALAAGGPVPSGVRAAAHITGGGLTGNLPRVLPRGVVLDLDPGAWPEPPVFGWLRRLGGIAEDEMRRAFNLGLGFCLVVAAGQAEAISDALAGAGATVHRVGRIAAATDQTAPPAVRYGA